MSRRVLERSDYLKLISSVSSSMFRLEALNQYRMPDEEETFRDFLNGEKFQPTDEDREWWNQLKKDKAAGKIRQRVHIVDLPLSDYVRYEVETGYVFYGPAGEDIKMIERKYANEVAKLPNEDFQLIDDETLIILRYDSEGRTTARELVENEPETVEKYKQYRDLAMQYATPFDQFYDRSDQKLQSGLAS